MTVSMNLDRHRFEPTPPMAIEQSAVPSLPPSRSETMPRMSASPVPTILLHTRELSPKIFSISSRRPFPGSSS